ncbi:MAG: DNA polymerase III subunit chi [Pseudomonadales bacterium]|nr:DNA polymerase III subunit chi [Pseudomonadales bacterium]
MTRIDFYILPDVDEIARHRFSCRLAHKAAVSGKRVHIRTTDCALDDVDALLWEYPTQHFLPHARLGVVGGEPVTLGTEDEEPTHDEVLINLGTEIPGFFNRFERVSEIVLATQRAAGRDKYRRYRDGGYPLFHHELDNWE